MNDSAQNSEKKYRQRIRHWTVKQDLKYKLFLILYADCLNANKKKTKIFRQMVIFTGKDEQKNRTHHEKMIHKFKKKKQPQKYMLYQFYYDHYYIRRLNEDHLKKQLRLFITESAVDQEYKHNLIQKAFRNVDFMKFEENCLQQKQDYQMNNQMRSSDSLEPVQSEQSLEPIKSQQSFPPIAQGEILIARQPPQIQQSPNFAQKQSSGDFDVWNFQNEQFNGFHATYMNIYGRQFL